MKRWWKAHELFADRRCGQSVLDFLSSTDVSKIVPTADVEDNAGGGASEGELREKGEREEEREPEVVALGTGNDGQAREEHRLFLLTPPFMVWLKRSRGRMGVSFPWCVFIFSWDRPGWRAGGCLHCAAMCGMRRGNGLYILLVVIYIGRTRVMNKQKKNHG